METSLDPQLLKNRLAEVSEVKVFLLRDLPERLKADSLLRISVGLREDGVLGAVIGPMGEMTNHQILINFHFREGLRWKGGAFLKLEGNPPAPTVTGKSDRIGPIPKGYVPMIQEVIDQLHSSGHV